ncbi:hypothetical protein LSH36_316g04031 [Paralvinella palmiformis]|uniref:D-dopachrome decarboxylase n=1 Tax=Paralvinella palmiformis TaxID=53620 RepID=A0AAD9N2Q6_9ANNE|nr:hypothetical protein LSH36_316g04031 [Paralvinella palmiformis]
MSFLRQLVGGVWRKHNSFLPKTITFTGQKRHLPYCSVDTNLGKAQLSPDFHIRFSKLLARILGKDEKLITVSLRTDVTMCRSGTDRPNIVINIWSIGVFDEQRNPNYTNQIYDFILPEVNIPAER